MRFGSLVFWVGFVGFMALSVYGYSYYMQGLRGHANSLQKATNKMGSLKQDMTNIRKMQTDAILGIDSGNKVKPTPRGVNSGGFRKKANNRINALKKRQKTLR